MGGNKLFFWVAALIVFLGIAAAVQVKGMVVDTIHTDMMVTTMEPVEVSTVAIREPVEVHTDVRQELEVAQIREREPTIVEPVEERIPEPARTEELEPIEPTEPIEPIIEAQGNTPSIPEIIKAVVTRSANTEVPKVESTTPVEPGESAPLPAPEPVEVVPEVRIATPIQPTTPAPVIIPKTEVVVASKITPSKSQPINPTEPQKTDTKDLKPVPVVPKPDLSTKMSNGPSISIVQPLVGNTLITDTKSIIESGVKIEAVEQPKQPEKSKSTNGCSGNLYELFTLTSIDSTYSLKPTAAYGNYLYFDIIKDGSYYTSSGITQDSETEIYDGKTTITIKFCSFDAQKNAAVLAITVSGGKTITEPPKANVTAPESPKMETISNPPAPGCNGVVAGIGDSVTVDTVYSLEVTAIYGNYVYFEVYENGNFYVSSSSKTTGESYVYHNGNMITVEVCDINNGIPPNAEINAYSNNPKPTPTANCSGPSTPDLYNNLTVVYNDGYSTNTHTDYCVDNTTTTKYWCSGNTVQTANYTCPTGYSCEYGACVVKPPTPLPLSCYDSDGGQNTSVKGNVTNDTGTYNDYCKNANTVSEYWCDSSNNTWASDIGCPTGFSCGDGACVKNTTNVTNTTNTTKPACYGPTTSNIYNKTTFNAFDGKVNKSYSDYCIGNTLVDHWCSADKATFSLVSCPTNYSCSSGACVLNTTTNTTNTTNTTPSVFTCSGPSTYNIYNKTSVNISNGTVSSKYTDSCTNNTGVQEYWCSGKTAVTANYSCPTNYSCSTGACVLNKTNTTNVTKPYCSGNTFTKGVMTTIGNNYSLNLTNANSTTATFDLYELGSKYTAFIALLGKTTQIYPANASVHVKLCSVSTNKAVANVTVLKKYTPPTCNETTYTKGQNISVKGTNYTVKLVDVKSTYAMFDVVKNGTVVGSINVSAGFTGHIWDGNTSIDIYVCGMNSTKGTVNGKISYLMSKTSASTYMPKKTSTFSVKPTAVYWGYIYMDIVMDGYTVSSYPVKIGETVSVGYENGNLKISTS